MYFGAVFQIYGFFLNLLLISNMYIKYIPKSINTYQSLCIVLLVYTFSRQFAILKLDGVPFPR